MKPIFLALLIFSLALANPVFAQTSKSSPEKRQFDLNASHTGLYVDPDWATSDKEDKMLPESISPMLPGNAKLRTEGQVEETSVTKVRLEENHGEVAVGVLGAYTTESDGSITKILPGSDLTRLGIGIGDKILTIDGKAYTNTEAFRNACRGLPGSTMVVIVERNGKTRPYLVKRTDARLYVNDSDAYYKWCVDQIKRW